MSSKDLRKAYHPNYFSIESILAAQELVPCRTQMRLPKFGFLVPGCNSENLPVGTNFQLPIWAARDLCKPRRVYVSVTVPPGFKGVHREVIDEDANVVDLTKVNVNYYEAGHLCTSLFHYDAGELAEMLPEVLQSRILCLGATTGTTIPQGTPLKSELMDNLEKEIFENTVESKNNLDEWLEVFHLPPEKVAELRRPPPPPPVQRQPVPAHHNNHHHQLQHQQQQQHQSHHHQQHQQQQQYPLRPVPQHNSNPQLPQRTQAHSQPHLVSVSHSSYGNPYAHLQTGGLPPPYSNINVAGAGIQPAPAHNVIAQPQHHQSQTHHHQGLPHSLYPHHHGHNM